MSVAEDEDAGERMSLGENPGVKGVKRKLDEVLDHAIRPALGDTVRIRDTAHIRKVMPHTVGWQVTITADDKSECPFRICRNRSEAPWPLHLEDVSLVATATEATSGKASSKRVLEFSGPKLKVLCSDSTAFMNFHRILQTCIQARKDTNPLHFHFKFEFNGHTISSEAERTTVDVTFHPDQKLGLKFKSHLPGLVKKVAPDSQADRAGVKKGWVVIKIDGRPFSEDEFEARAAGDRDFNLTFEHQANEEVRFLNELSVGDVVSYSSEFNASYGRKKTMQLTVTGACLTQNTPSETPWERPKLFDDGFLPRCAEATSGLTRDTANWRLCHMRFDILKKPKEFENADLRVVRFGNEPSPLFNCLNSFSRDGPGKHRREATVKRMSLDLEGELAIAKANDDSLSDVKIDRA